VADVRLVVLVPAELKAALEAQAKAEDRTLASLVRRILSSEDWKRRAPAPGPTIDISRVPVGGQDAAAGKGVEERLEATMPDSLLPMRSVGVVIGGEDCSHPLRFRLGTRCQATGCGKVVR